MSELALTAVVFRDDLYPRLETSATTVQKYAEDLSVLPPIEVNQHNELIDGWHRWTAHKKVNAETIKIIRTETKSDAELMELGIQRNSVFGLQLSNEDKQSMARKIYNATPEKEREGKKEHLAKILSVSLRTVADWLSRIDKDTKEARNKRIFALWLACYTQEEIAVLENVSVQPVKDVISDFYAELPKNLKLIAAADHVTEFDVPYYNVWKQQEKTTGSKHFGNSEVRWVDNLLYLYTKPLDVVIDPFAGGGSTLDICKKRLRRYWVSDRLPPIEREHDIRKHDIADGLPPLPQWKDVRLAYLDPPYWKQAEGKYSKDAGDLANMSLDDFHVSLASFINSLAKKVPASGVIALLLQPTQWNAPDREYTDHVAEMIRMVKLPIDLRVQCPYESQQCNAQMTEWAKQNKKLLVLSRELVIWRGKA